MFKLFPLSPQQQRKSLGDQVYESIRKGIVSLHLEPGGMVYENELAESLQISRTPIREAIRTLVNEELLEVLPQRGTRIAKISERKVNEARFIREHLELGAFRMAARLWNEELHLPIRQSAQRILEQQQAAAIAGDIDQFLQLDEEFHRAIMEIMGNATLLQVIYHMRGHLNRLRYLALKELHHMDIIIEEHRDLFTAITQGNEELAVKKLGQHLGKLDYELPELRKAYPNYFLD
jgi:DNA-binding GntR family transcriptional regulator